MKHHVSPVFSHCLVITAFMLIVVTQSDAQMTLPYNGTTNTGFFAFRINHLGTGRTAIYGKPVPELSAFDTEMNNYMRDHNISSGVLAVSRKGIIIYQSGFGRNYWDQHNSYKRRQHE